MSALETTLWTCESLCFRRMSCFTNWQNQRKTACTKCISDHSKKSGNSKLYVHNRFS